MSYHFYTHFIENQLFKKFRKASLALVLLLMISPVFGQFEKGSISGTVKDSIGNPIEFVSVRLKDQRKQATTNQKGEFKIEGLEDGNYTVVTQLYGFKSTSKEVVVANKESVVVLFVLNEEHQETDEIEINVDGNKFGKKESEFAGKMPLKDLENPQVYNTVTAELLKDQVITNVDDAFKNAPGVDKRWESTGRGTDGAGYFSMRGFAVQPTLVNGLPGLTNGGLDPANIERIEVLKGPSGTLYGSSLISYGGLINIVTKRPYDYFGGEITYSSGSFGLNRIAADINTPLSKDKKVALRMNGAYQNENSFQDAGFKKTLFFAPSLSYQATDRLSFLVNTEFYSSEGTNPTMLFLNRYAPLVSKNLEELNYNNKRSYTSNDVTIKNPSFGMQGQMKYKISDSWTSQTVVSTSSAKSDGYYSYLWDFADGNGSYGRYFNKQNSVTYTTDLQQNFIGDFKIGSLRNRMVAGLDYFSKTGIDAGTGYKLYDVVTIGQADPTQLNRISLDTTLSKAGTSKNTTKQTVYSAYVSDVLNFTPAISLMMSLRYDYFDNQGTVNALTNTKSGDFGQSALSPKLGLVYQPIKDKLSVFANYMNGFTNVAPKVQPNMTVKSFKPEQANQWEIGAKSDFLNGKVTTTLSYYDIEVNNIVMSDPLRGDNQGGRRNSKGIEASVVASPVQGLNIIAGYSYNEGKITKTDDPDYLGRRSEEAGPQHMANAWVSYKVGFGKLKGLGLGFGGNYSGEYATLNRLTTGVFNLPSYTVLNSSLFYDGGKYRITLKVNNLTDKEYYSGWSTINPQKPRNVVASVSYKF